MKVYFLVMNSERCSCASVSGISGALDEYENDHKPLFISFLLVMLFGLGLVLQSCQSQTPLLQTDWLKPWMLRDAF